MSLSDADLDRLLRGADLKEIDDGDQQVLQLVERKWLGHVRRCAGGKATQGIFGTSARGQHQHRHAATWVDVTVQPLQHGETVG